MAELKYKIGDRFHKTIIQETVEVICEAKNVWRTVGKGTPEISSTICVITDITNGYYIIEEENIPYRIPLKSRIPLQSVEEYLEGWTQLNKIN